MSMKPVLFAAALLSAAAPLPTFAQETAVTAQSVAHRIDVAGRQRMLTQRMAKYFCYARSNVNPAESAAILTKAMGLFEATHIALKAGNTDQEIFAETHTIPLAKWEELNSYWNPLKAIYENALGGTLITEEEFARANGLTGEALKRANDLVVANRTAYASFLGDGAAAEALLIDLYGRQRMLSQKLSKEVCLVSAGFNVETAQPELQATLELFDNSLNAFINGMPIAGIPTPPTRGIADQLALAKSEWDAVRDIAVTVAAGNATNLSDLGRFAKGTDAFLTEMNKAVGMLAEYDAAQS